MFEQKQAILKLLADEDPQTVDLVKGQLSARGTPAMVDLRDLLLSADDVRAARHVRALLAELDSKTAREEMVAALKSCESLADLERICWVLSRSELPGIEPDSRRTLLDTWAEELRPALATHSDPRVRVSILAEKLGADLGFTGNTEDYYNARNSLLPSVIDSRLGIPISLSLIYLLVARRAGLPAEGVNLPGHFILRHEDVLFDPFHGGKIISVKDCAEILARQKMRLEKHHLEAAFPSLILLRMLANLLYVYEQDQDEEGKERVAAWMRALESAADAA